MRRWARTAPRRGWRPSPRTSRARCAARSVRARARARAAGAARGWRRARPPPAWRPASRAPASGHRGLERREHHDEAPRDAHPSVEANANERTLVYPWRARTTPCATPSMSPSSSPPTTPSSGKKLAAVLPGSMAALATSTESARATTSPSASARAVAITSAGSSGRGRADMVSLYRVTSGVHSPGGVGRRASDHWGWGQRG
jgi:hypothetical protein